jgi:2-oxoisovalerate dehydrogenase E1 component alpha subunit
MPRPKLVHSKPELGSMPKELLVQMHDLMIKSRVLEERLIQLYKQGHGYFWVGGPGEEAFNVPLGLLMKKGQGPAYDYLHAHYRQSATLLALGEDPIGSLRQMRGSALDPYSAGRNFVSHYSIRKWNIPPVSSPIEVQYAVAPGTAYAQKRAGGDGITIVTGGDAGTAEGDFTSCLVWSSRPNMELPILIVVTNNKWGISTPADSQHGETQLSDRGRAFNIRSKTIDGNDPVVAYHELREAFDYVRKERKPFLMEATVSRLYGHSSASGANLVSHEADCIRLFEERLLSGGILTRQEMDAVRERWTQEIADKARQIRDEPLPSADSVYKHIFKEDA